MFESLFNVLDENIKKKNGIEVQLSDQFEEKFSKDSKSVMRNFLYELPGFRKWRITKLDGGDKLQVLNTVAYPNFHSEMPILGVDILWFGNTQKLLAVLDYQPLIQNIDYLNNYCSGLKIIKDKYLECNNSKMKNIYDQNQYFSPWVILHREDKSSDGLDLNHLFSSFLENYLEMSSQSKKNKFLNAEEIKRIHVDYDKYSAERDPAGKLFKSFFGDIWTKDFLKNFLFTLS